MKRVELYARVRHAVMIDGLSQREAAWRFGIDPRTVRKMLSYSVPPGYVRTRLPVRPKLDPFIGLIDRILEEDKERPKKQRHTSKRIYERLRDEHGFTGGITIVKDYICGARQRHPPCPSSTRTAAATAQTANTRKPPRRFIPTPRNCPGITYGQYRGIIGGGESRDKTLGCHRAVDVVGTHALRGPWYCPVSIHRTSPNRLGATPPSPRMR